MKKFNLLENDLKHERMQELAQEYREGAKDVWIKEHLEDLKSDFIENSQDEFDFYCSTIFDEMDEWLFYPEDVLIPKTSYPILRMK